MVNHIIYKICCDDCEFVYIGSTINFRQRKSFHKINSISKNEKSEYTLYKTINEYGGWDNWRMVPVEELDGENLNKSQIKIKEEEWRVKLCKKN